MVVKIKNRHLDINTKRLIEPYNNYFISNKKANDLTDLFQYEPYAKL